MWVSEVFNGILPKMKLRIDIYLKLSFRGFHSKCCEDGEETNKAPSQYSLSQVSVTMETLDP